MRLPARGCIKLELSWEFLKRQAVKVCSCAGANGGRYQSHNDTPAELLGAHAHTLVDAAVLLYAVGMQVAYQRISTMVRLFPACLNSPV